LSADELWEGFLLGVGPSGAYATDLRPERAAEVRACLYARLPVTSDRSVHLTATALAMAGTSP
jgi:hypothetical protein